METFQGRLDDISRILKFLPFTEPPAPCFPSEREITQSACSLGGITTSINTASQPRYQQLTDSVRKPGKALLQCGSVPLETTLHSTETTSCLKTSPRRPQQLLSCFWPILRVKSNQQLCQSNTPSPLLDPQSLSHTPDRDQLLSPILTAEDTVELLL